MFYIQILFSLVLGSVVFCAKDPNQEYVLVETESGAVRGITELTLLNKRIFYSFKGIPYAKSPTGNLRFKAPRKVDPWSDILNATEYGDICLQATADMTHGAEDCLTLNVFSPNIKPTAQLPVIFYIHGGGFMSGGAYIQGPEILLDEDIILVTINYRLGPFGFLNLDTPEYSGNMGLKDQFMALKWVNENIHSFGGDKQQITIYGHSAGSTSVHFHTLSPVSRGLFQRAIASSGSVLNTFAYSTRNHTSVLMDLMSKETQSNLEHVHLNDVIEWMQKVDGKYLGKSTFVPLFTGGTRTVSINLTWTPVIETANSHQPFIIKSSEEYFKEPSDIDSLFGYMMAESIDIAPSVINNPGEYKSFDEHFEIGLPLAQLNYSFDSDAFRLYKEEIRNFYFGNKSINGNSVPEFLKLLDDTFFIYGIDKSVKAQAKRSSGKTYYFQFSAVLGLNYFRFAANATQTEIKGATHCEDMLYIFKVNDWAPASIYDGLKLDSDEVRMIKTLRTFIVNFVKFGNPTPQKEPVNVRPIEDNIINFVDIQNDGLVTGVNPHEKSISFWDNFFMKHTELGIRVLVNNVL